MKLNPVTAEDFYKSGHPFQYPPGTTCIYSNFTARSAKHAKVAAGFDQKFVFFGLQGFIKWYLIDLWNTEFFQKPKGAVIGAYKRRMDTALGVDSVPVEKLEALHDLGYLPLHIKALPEGSRVNIKVPFVTVVNTLPEFYWLTNKIETALSCEVWKPSTVATIAYEFRRQLSYFVDLTGSSQEFAEWQNHDFSMRGMSGIHDASSSCAGHLLSSYGTDTIPAIDYLEHYYNADAELELIGGSVPATEHSIMCAGTKEGERETYRHLIEDVYPSGVVSIVSDTWDFWNVLTNIIPSLKDVILARKPNSLGLAKVVLRPDSGNPTDIICGTARICHPEGTPEEKGAVELLWETFGGTLTDKGFKTLHDRIGLIYGDSISLEVQAEILTRLMVKGFSAGNLVFGVGSYTYQFNTRDSLGMAMKATYAVVDGAERELFKDPITDVGGFKKSAKGLLMVEKVGKNFVLHDQVDGDIESTGALETVFYNGKLIRDSSLAEIRATLRAS